MSLNRRAVPCFLCASLLVTTSVFAYDAVDIAVEQLTANNTKKEYVYGGNGPDAFDCAGLTKFAYGHVGVDLTRRAIEQSTEAESYPVVYDVNSSENLDKLQRGDLLFFDTARKEDEENNKVNHVTIYEGDATFINASWVDVDIVRTSFNHPEFGAWWKSHFMFALRPTSPQAISMEFVTNQFVELKATANVRGDPLGRDTIAVGGDDEKDKNPDYVKTVEERSPPAKGVIQSKPIYSGYYTKPAVWRWFVNFESGADGWVAEEFLKPVGGGGGGPMRIEDVPFEDSALRLCVNNLATHYGWTHPPEVTILSCGGSMGIASLKGLEHFTSLEELWLDDNVVNDLSPISGLTKLKVLSLTDNHTIPGLSPLRGLTELTWLSLRGLNPFSSISDLSNLKKLQYLNLLGNGRVTNISALQGLTALQELDLQQTGISSVSALGGLNKLRTLSLMFTAITDLQPLFNLTNLESLLLGDCNRLSCPQLEDLIDALPSTRISAPAHCYSVGECGTKAGGACSSSLRSTTRGLCSSGSVGSFRSTASGWTWTCVGSGGGGDTSCSENRCN